MSKNPLRVDMSALAVEAAQGLRALAGQRTWDDSIKTAIARAARRVGFTYSRTFTLWYKNAKRIDAHEIEAIRTARRAQQDAIANELRTIEAEFQELAARFASLQSAMAGKEADAWGSLAREAGSLADEVGGQP